MLHSLGPGPAGPAGLAVPLSSSLASRETSIILDSSSLATSSALAPSASTSLASREATSYSCSASNTAMVDTSLPCRQKASCSTASCLDPAPARPSPQTARDQLTAAFADLGRHLQPPYRSFMRSLAASRSYARELTRRYSALHGLASSSFG